MNTNVIPEEMKNIPQWIGWQNVDGIKQPINPKTGQLGKVNNANTWGTFEEAIDAVSRYNLSGIGLVFSNDVKMTGFDFDECIDESENIHPEVKEILKRLNSYSEISPSGKGIKVWVKGRFNLDRGHKVTKDGYDIEAYNNRRYFTVTTNVIEPYRSLNESPEAEKIYQELFPAITVPEQQADSDDYPVMEAEVIADALKYIASDDYDTWIRIGFALKSWAANGGDDESAKGLWMDWSRRSPKFNLNGANIKWGQLNSGAAGTGLHAQQGRRITIGTLIAMAKQGGWTPKTTPTQATFPLTEYGNAERLVKRHGEDVRYAHDIKSWFIWDGKRWKLDETGKIFRFAKDTVRGIPDEAPTEQSLKTITDKKLFRSQEKLREDIVKHAKRSESDRAIKAMICLAGSETPTAISTNLLDQNGDVINVMNGTFDLKRLTLLPHKRDDLITKIMPVEAKTEAQYPTWTNFLEKVMNGDETMIQYLQRAAGYSLTSSTQEQNLFFLYGTGANGKTTFCDILMAILGDYAQKAPSTLISLKKAGFEGVPNDMARLRGARLAICSELGENQTLNESLIKDLTGADKIVARYMRGEFFEFFPSHKLWVYGNHRPLIYGADHGIWRRIHLIPFEVTISDDEKDPLLKDKLRNELSGILMWMIKGYFKWVQMGLAPPEKVVSATNAYRNEIDSVGTFIEECCELNSGQSATSGALYGRYQSWSDQRGEHPMGMKKFGQRLRERGCVPVKESGSRAWKGISLTTDYPF